MNHNYFTDRKTVVAISALLISAGASAVDQSKLQLAHGQPSSFHKSSVFIVKLKDASSVQHAQALRNIAPKKGIKATNFQYDAKAPANASYAAQLINKQRSVIKATGIKQPIYNYAHTFNGFTVKLTPKQVELLSNHPDIAAVYPDERQQLTTANTPKFLGLSGDAGLHTSLTGEGVIVGVVDSGLNFQHPSFADDGSYSDPASLGWKGSCNDAGDENVICSNKVIGAYHFNASAIASNPGLAFEDGEYQSPRDFGGHGTHVASTAAGVATPASVNGFDAGIATGMAPRARVAAYKACWDFVDPDKNGCYGGDTMAAIEQATKDGVDVINYSIGGSLTNLITPAAQAFLNATASGVFVATSAGNSGPEAETVGMPVPWVTNVAASTYSGSVPTSAIAITGGSLNGEKLLAERSGFGPQLEVTGEITGELIVSSPLEACEPLTNASEIAGKVAFISRGSCAFVQKVQNAEAAGAAAVVVFNNKPGEAPIAMGGDGTTNILSMMIGNTDGKTIESELVDGESISVQLSAEIQTIKSLTGNSIADFSSRGPSKAVVDLIVPDISAPGVKILAASPIGGEFQYMQGTSMASPHIAGIAALIKQAHPDWSPAAIRSAMMTTARQNLVKEDNATPADPFDFGAGHVVPTSATEPGLVYEAGLADYVGFICGKANEVATIESTYGAGICAFLESKGYKGGSDFNHPSIGISALGKAQRVLRFVTNVTESTSTYKASVIAPAGITIALSVYDEASQSLLPTDSFTVEPGQTAVYAMDFDKEESAALGEWSFGSITWSDGVHQVFSPIAVKPEQADLLEVAANIETQAVRSMHRLVLPYKPDFTGIMRTVGYGMAEAQQFAGYVAQDADQEYSFNEEGLGFHAITIGPGVKALKFALYTSELPDPEIDLDLVVYACADWSCSLVGQSAFNASDESVVLVNPTPLYENEGDFYLIFVHGWSLNGADAIDYPLNVTTVGGTNGNMMLRASPIARQGIVGNAYFFMRGLEKGKHYFGGASFLDRDGKELDFTTLSVEYP